MKTMASSVVFLCLSGVLHAHPHVFVNAQAGFQIDANHHLQALRISWRYDAFTTLYLFDALDLDSDGDGKLSSADRASIAAAETDWPPGYNGDVHLQVAGETRELTRPQHAKAEMVDGEIIVSFELPLDSPAALSEQAVSLKLYDPAYYYAYTLTVDADAQRLEKPCKATEIPFAPDKAEAETLLSLATLSREETPSEADIGARFTDEIVLTCK